MLALKSRVVAAFSFEFRCAAGKEITGLLLNIIEDQFDGWV
ncbi:hypothetical protein [Paenibacillus sp. CECT 9249]|nr:hypothetical protein [Paenibacillus sp. CECT 9249]